MQTEQVVRRVIGFLKNPAHADWLGVLTSPMDVDTFLNGDPSLDQKGFIARMVEAGVIVPEREPQPREQRERGERSRDDDWEKECDRLEEGLRKSRPTATLSQMTDSRFQKVIGGIAGARVRGGIATDDEALSQLAKRYDEFQWGEPAATPAQSQTATTITVAEQQPLTPADARTIAEAAVQQAVATS